MFNSVVSKGLQLVGNGLSRFNTGLQISRSLHLTTNLNGKHTINPEPKEFLRYNDIVYPPQDPSAPRLPAEVVHQRAFVKYSTKNLTLISNMVRGMSVDEATKQLAFYNKKGGPIVKEIIEEAQEIAVRDHNVEFKSNMWIENIFATRAMIVKGQRKHARRNPGVVNYRYSHVFLRLREGKPPQHYYPPPPTGNQQVADRMEQLRDRTIRFGL